MTSGDGITIDDTTMTAVVGGQVVAYARYSRHAAADGGGAWQVWHVPGITGRRLFGRNQAITALSIAERIALGYGDDDPFVTGWREEIGVDR
jgi:hypothetical protein